MLKHFINSTTGEYIKSAMIAVKMGFTTSQPLPDVELAENEYFSMLDPNGNVQYWPDDRKCTWQVKTRFEKVTAYSKETKEPKQFDDKTLVADEYTLIQPPHQYVTWIEELGYWEVDTQALNMKPKFSRLIILVRVFMFRWLIASIMKRR
ncbi:hypothetical protein DDN47_03260 [Vibrio cholerae]|nr:hypothetical protein [Vibrio cholerae]